jgi:transcriptional regulator with XRE-family HTH domain
MFCMRCCGAFVRAAQHALMAPVKKPPHDRSKTFIKAWRKFRDLTQEETAERIGIDATTFGRVERGILPYDQDFLEKAAFAFSCEPTDLVDIDPLRPDPPKLVYSKLKAAPRELQIKAMEMVEILLRNAS